MAGASKRSGGGAVAGEKIPAVWFALKRSLHCKPEPSDVHEPTNKKDATATPTRGPARQLGAILTKKKKAAAAAAEATGCSSRSGCSRSISNLKDVVIHGGGSKRHGLDQRPSCSPRSIGSSEFINPIAHEVVLSGSTCELKITGFGDYSGGFQLGTLRPGTPGPGGCAAHFGLSASPIRPAATPPRRSSHRPIACSGAAARPPRPPSIDGDSAAAAAAAAAIVCHKCGEQFGKWEAAESHHLSKHAVTELAEGDSSRKIVEIICKASWLKSESNCGRIERVLKVHNMQKTLARFEEYRESVKIKASKLAKNKHPRCLADGNELLRFHGTTVSCSLGAGGSSSLCSSERCSVCRIIRHGFSINKQDGGTHIGVFTTCTSGRAFESINGGDGGESSPAAATRKALLVCRVIAGRVHKPVDSYQEMLAGGNSAAGFDSVAGKVGIYANIEELYLLNPRALLPCFVVICKP